MYLRRVQLIGNNLMVAIPRPLARELGLTRHDFVQLTRLDGRAVRLVVMEVTDDDGAHISASAPIVHRRAAGARATLDGPGRARRAGG
jgi:hypothetical protein